jgi:hypothetical protein
VGLLTAQFVHKFLFAQHDLNFDYMPIATTAVIKIIAAGATLKWNISVVINIYLQ